MKARRSSRGSRQAWRTSAVVMVVLTSLACVAIDARDGVLTWSLITSAGSAAVLAFHAWWQHLRPAPPALQLVPVPVPVRTARPVPPRAGRRVAG